MDRRLLSTFEHGRKVIQRYGRSVRV